MAKTAKSCLQLLLKIVNSTMGIVGITMVMYSIWMVRVWARDLDKDSISDDSDNNSIPWFINPCLGIGITFCGIACLGHIAAVTANPCCLSFYMVTIFVVLLVETGCIADIYLNSDWVKDFPNDRTGKFDDFKDFVESNFIVCKWIVLLIILAQGFSVLLAKVLRSLRRASTYRSYYESNRDPDEENAEPRLSLLDHPDHPLHDAALDFTFPNRNIFKTNE